MTEKDAINSSVKISEHLMNLICNFRSIGEVDFVGVNPLLWRCGRHFTEALNLSWKHLVVPTEQCHLVWLRVFQEGVYKHWPDGSCSPGDHNIQAIETPTEWKVIWIHFSSELKRSIAAHWGHWHACGPPVRACEFFNETSEETSSLNAWSRVCLVTVHLVST